MIIFLSLFHHSSLYLSIYLSIYLSLYLYIYLFLGILSDSSAVSDDHFLKIYPEVMEAIVTTHELDSSSSSSGEQGRIEVEWEERGKGNSLGGDLTAALMTKNKSSTCLSKNTSSRNNKLDLSFEQARGYGSSSMVTIFSNALCFRGQLDKVKKIEPPNPNPNPNTPIISQIINTS
jgi:hypothetical protein